MSNFRAFLRTVGASVAIVASGVAGTVASGAAGDGQSSTTASAQAPRSPSTSVQPSDGIPPSAGIAVPGDFVIGPEDVLGILFWREPDFSGDVAVRPDGRITLPLIGDMMAAGVTTSVLRDQIQAAGAKFLTDPNVTVIVRQINSRKVFITGEIGAPGAFPLTGPRTVMQLISLAGGLTQYAKAESISILRQEQGRTRAYSFNYKDVSTGKNVQQNIELLPGDTIVVP